SAAPRGSNVAIAPEGLAGNFYKGHIFWDADVWMLPALLVDRREPFAGRVPIDVRNLPYGVRVLDIGLNGVLITETQKQREIRIYAEPWVKAQKRPFFAVGRAESAGTSDSSPPIMLEVESR
ncbi:MAG: hypothetical protein ACKO5E_12775, partial [bacterium]